MSDLFELMLMLSFEKQEKKRYWRKRKNILNNDLKKKEIWKMSI
jgi:hypothetical protein